MKIGVSLSILAQAGRSDVAVYKDHLELGDLAEPLGFDSIFALEHHFTGYSMSPAPTQLLSYFAGRTKRVALGTAVIVLPWHDPIRVAEQIALLDVLCGGRCLFGFGRGAASRGIRRLPHPDGGGAPALRRSGAAHPPGAQPAGVRMAGRVLPDSRAPRSARGRSPTRSGGSSSPRSRPESAEIMAKLGFGMMVIMQNEWPKAAADIDQFREIAGAVGHVPPPPIILTNVSCAESRDEAHERAMHVSRAEVGFDRQPLPFLGRASGRR